MDASFLEQDMICIRLESMFLNTVLVYGTLSSGGSAG